MQVYEFHTTIKNGFIQIPDEYKNKVGDRIKVTIVSDEQSDADWNRLFPPMIDTKAWKFNREEANER